VELVADLLDKLVVDRNGREMGRVDGIAIEQRDGMPPRVAALQIGAAVLGYRLHPAAGRFVAGLEQAFGVADRRPVRISVGDLMEIGIEVKVNVAIGETGAANVEDRLRAWVVKLPGSG
jgi:hypothetical protein